jgi:drug/metabolite transporter (DMT)-like permease
MLVVGVLSISTAALFIKKCNQEVSPSVIAAARLGIASVILAGTAVVTRRRQAIQIPRDVLPLILLAGILLAAHFFFWITSLSHTSVLSSVVIVTTNPIFVGIASLFIFREPLRRNLILGIALAAAGGLFIALSDSGKSGTLYGNLMSLLGAIMASCYLLIGRRVRQRVDNLSYIVTVYSIAAIVLIVVAGFSGQNLLHYRASTYAYLFLLAIVPQLIGHSCLNWALAHASATLVAVCILGEPIGASILACVFLQEKVRGLQALGGALILSGIVLATRQESSVKQGLGDLGP